MNINTKIPKTLVDPNIYKSLLSLKILTFVKNNKLTDNVYIISIFHKTKLNNNKNKTSGIIVNEYVVESIKELVKLLIKLYIMRGTAIWISKLKLRNDNDTFDMKIKKKDIYGNNILNYSKKEKMFNCYPKDCNIHFKLYISQNTYDIDTILSDCNNIYNKNHLI